MNTQIENPAKTGTSEGDSQKIVLPRLELTGPDGWDECSKPLVVEIKSLRFLQSQIALMVNGIILKNY